MTIIVGISCGIMSAALFELGKALWVRRWRRNLKKLLEFPRDKDLYIVYPPRKGGETGLLPHTSTEDFMAINNLISAFLSSGWKNDRFIVRDTGRLTAQQELENIVVICSPKSNKLGEKLQRKLLEDNVKFFYFSRETIDGREQSVVTSQKGGIYRSPAEKAEYEHKMQEEEKPLHAAELQDYAVITKVRNPWNRQSWMLSVAGIRGIGTWGAAETLKKWHQQLFSVVKRARAWQTGSFSAVLLISYNNSDIVGSKVVDFISINDVPGN